MCGVENTIRAVSRGYWEPQGWVSTDWGRERQPVTTGKPTAWPQVSMNVKKRTCNLAGWHGLGSDSVCCTLACR